MSRNRRKKKKSILLPILVVFLLVLLAVDLAFLLPHYTWAAGGVYAKDSDFVDARGKTLTAADYQELCAALPGAQILWDVPLEGQSVPCDASRITIRTLSETDYEMLAYLPNLAEVQAEGCRDYARLLTLSRTRPDVAVHYTVNLGGREYEDSAVSAVVENPSAPELMENLQYLPRMTEVRLEGALPEADALISLRKAFPDISFRWTLEIDGKTVENSVRELDLSGKNLHADWVAQIVGQLPEVTKVDMRNCSLSDEELIGLANRFPETTFLWEIQIGEYSFLTDAEEIDISGYQVKGVEEVERLLPCFGNLKRVVMCRCGLDNETMDALNRSHEDIRFIWSFMIQDVELRTDITWFYPFKYHKDMIVTTDELYPLRYCEDMLCVDIGHMTTVTNCDWVAFMPKLKYLIIIETDIRDITPLSNLKNLVFLEMFSTKITDYTPLLGCTALEDLNLGCSYGDEEPILQMTWLKHLWWSGIEGTVGLPCSDAPQRLRAGLPNTVMKFNLETPNANNGWRQLQNYYDMRDLMDVFYLT